MRNVQFIVRFGVNGQNVARHARGIVMSYLTVNTSRMPGIVLQATKKIFIITDKNGKALFGVNDTFNTFIHLTSLGMSDVDTV